MQQKIIYKYTGENNSGFIITPLKLPMEGTEMVRLVADKGKILTNGFTKLSVIDVGADDISNWIEENKEQKGE